jgi:hypothetical protein
MARRIGSAKGQPLREVRMNGTELSGRATAIFHAASRRAYARATARTTIISREISGCFTVGQRFGG